MSTEFSVAYFILATYSLAKRELVRFIRQKSRMIGVIGSPLVFWFLIGSGLSGSFRHPSAPPEMNYLEYFFPGTIVLIILFTSIFSTMSIIEDRKEGFLQSVIVSPVPRGAIAMGKIMGGTALALLQAMLLLLLTPFLGITLDPLSFVAVFVTLFLISFGLTGLGFLIAWKMDSTQGFHAIMNLFLIPLWLLSGSLFPASGAAGWLGAAMMANPITYGVAALRQALYMRGHTGTEDLSPLAVNLGVTVLFALVTFAGSTLLVNQRSKS